MVNKDGGLEQIESNNSIYNILQERSEKHHKESMMLILKDIGINKESTEKLLKYFDMYPKYTI